MSTNIPSENTSGRREAMAALRESKKANVQADLLIEESRTAISSVRQARMENHFAIKFRAIIKGESVA